MSFKNYTKRFNYAEVDLLVVYSAFDTLSNLQSNASYAYPSTAGGRWCTDYKMLDRAPHQQHMDLDCSTLENKFKSYRFILSWAARSTGTRVHLHPQASACYLLSFSWVSIFGSVCVTTSPVLLLFILKPFSPVSSASLTLLCTLCSVFHYRNKRWHLRGRSG